jgi:hypothetical protein
MLIIDLTYSKHSDNVAEIMFHAVNNDWFVALFPLSDVELDKMKEYYIGRDFYEEKKSYEGKIFAEGDKYNV